MSNLVGALVSNNLATIKELEKYYSYDDALDLLEVLRVKNYNEWAALEIGKDGNRY